MPSPVSIKHSEPHAHAIGWLSYCRAATPNVRAGGSGTVRLDMQNEFQPDVSLLIEPECGGQTRVSKEGYVEGAPELVVEVARSSVGIDLHDKLRAYLRNGVREYIVWRVDDGALDWFVLREGRYEPLAPAADGICRSEVFPGLWLDSAALLRGDFAAVRKAAEQGLASPEHAQFAARLQEAAAKAAQK